MWKRGMLGKCNVKAGHRPGLLQGGLQDSNLQPRDHAAGRGRAGAIDSSCLWRQLNCKACAPSFHEGVAHPGVAAVRAFPGGS